MSELDIEQYQPVLELAAPNGIREQLLGMETVRNEDITIDTYRGIYPPESIGLSTWEDGCRLSVVGEIGVPIVDRESGQDTIGHAALIKVDHPGGWSEFGLQGLTEGADGRATIARGTDPVYIMAGSSFVLGRNANHPRELEADTSLVSAEELWGVGTAYSLKASRRQTEIRADDDTVYVRDLNSLNGTRLKAYTVSSRVRHEQDEQYEASHTVGAVQLARELGLLSADGKTFGGRTVVTRDTTLGGPNPEATVDIRTWQADGEAIVIDPTTSRHPEQYDHLRNAFLRRLDRYQGEYTEEDVLEAIYDTVDDAMEYSREYADQVLERTRHVSPVHRKINLSSYLLDGKGVCRHMALAAAWLGGEAAALGLLTGRLTAPVNQHKGGNGAHEWARYTTTSGRVYILDVAQHYFGTLEASTVRKDFWNYFQPGEREAYMQRFGHLATQQRERRMGRGAVDRSMFWE